MLLGVFPLQLIISFLCSVCYMFSLLGIVGCFFLLLPIWYSACLFVLDRHLFLYITEVFLYNFVKDSFCDFDLSLFFYNYYVFIVFKSSCKFHSWVLWVWRFLWLNDLSILPGLQALILTSSWHNLLASLSFNISFTWIILS